jgi:hypothetical protein
MKRREDDVDLEIDTRTAKRTIESEIAREMREFTQGYFSSRGYMLRCFMNRHDEYPRGLYFSVSTISVKSREAKQALINIFNLYIWKEDEVDSTMLVSHLDWPEQFGHLYGFIPPPRFPCSRITTIELLDSMAECI